MNVPGDSFSEFVSLIARLRAPGGCPWDAAQTHESLIPNMLEEPYEAVDAIERRDVGALREELGDVLLQVVLQAQIASDAGEFTIDEVIGDIQAKMIRRHPHVFAPEEMADSIDTPDATKKLWARIKREEKGGVVEGEQPQAGLYDDIALGMPALMLASDISKKAVAAGFDWDDPADIWDKVAEEIQEFKEAPARSEASTEEMGDILFTMVNVARAAKVNPEAALRTTCRKFITRWSLMEAFAARDGHALDTCTVEQQEVYWQQAKRELAQEKEASQEMAPQQEEKHHE